MAFVLSALLLAGTIGLYLDGSRAYNGLLVGSAMFAAIGGLMTFIAWRRNRREQRRR
jgi:hypothetical protein